MNSRQEVPIETTTLATRNVLMTKYTAAPSATAATWPALSEPDGAAMPRLTASPAPAAMSTWPTLNADLTTERLRLAWARTVATPRVPSVTSGGTSRASITKKPSSMLSASDSAPRYTMTGHAQLPRARTPMTPATIHWRSCTPCHGRVPPQGDGQGGRAARDRSRDQRPGRAR